MEAHQSIEISQALNSKARQELKEVQKQELSKRIHAFLIKARTDKKQLSSAEADELDELVDHLHSDEEFVLPARKASVSGGGSGDPGDSDDVESEAEVELKRANKFSKSTIRRLAKKARKGRLRKGDFQLLIIGDAVVGDKPQNVSQRIPALSITLLPSEAEWRTGMLSVGPNGEGLIGVLGGLQRVSAEVANSSNPPLTSTRVHPTGIMFLDNNSKKKNDFVQLEQFTTVNKFGRDGTETVRLGLFVSWTESPFSAGSETFLQLPLHCGLVAVISAQRLDGMRSAGKTLLIGEPNVLWLNREERDLDNISLGHFRSLFDNVVDKHNIQQIFINTPRKERNNGGHCFVLTLEWMAEIVIKGLDIQWNEAGGVQGITGFRRIDSIQKKDKKVLK
ncbi:hypothetical protein GGX14DRAFT_391530 [Mycena pura]|uniref:Uncharacterized protein n=1 Tax=Mycena pura TaxID=153505 RepID=A0AAD6YDT3_9AGAR|nr:hypothetical protein GGX14DRAFT_391530 [Mycena pura]